MPLFAQPNGARGFEGDRFILLRLIGLVALAGVLLSSRPRRAGAARRIIEDPAPALAWLYLSTSFVAAFLSETPWTALPGSYGRQAGLVSDLALVGLFFAARRIGHGGGAAERRLENGVIGAGAVVAALALVQTIAPLVAPTLSVPFLEGGARATSISGGPTFLGSHLAAVLPLAATSATTRARRLVTLLFAAALVVTGSRAALVAATLGLLIVAALEPARRRGVLVGIGVGATALALACLPAVRAVLPSDALPNRIVQGFTTDQAGTRAHLYGDAIAAIVDRPLRAVIGHGPDSAEAAFTPAVSESLQRRLGGAVVVDRMHSDLLDVVWSRGLLAALGLFGLIGMALYRARRLLRNAAPDRIPDRTLVIAWTASLAAVTVDGLLSVPGAVSRLALFVAAGWLVGRATRARSETPNAASAAEASPESDAAARGALVGAGGAIFLFAVADVTFAGFAALLLILFPTERRGVALRWAAIAFAPFLIAHVALDPVGATAFEGVSPETSALRGRLDSLALLATIGVALVLLVRTSRRRDSALPTLDRPARLLAAVAALLLLGAWGRDDIRRVLADVDARVAFAADRVARRPDLAAALLERAAAAAPEVSRYRTRAAFALADHARRPGSDDPDLLLRRAGVQVGLVLEKEPRHALAIAQGAAAVLAFARALPDHRYELTERAWSLVQPVVALAPTSTPVLQIAAEIALARDDAERAAPWLERALAIDASSARSWQLLGRTEAARRNLSGAAYAYGRANALGAAREERTGVFQRSRLEALAGLALASAATEQTSDAATLINVLAARVDGARDFASEVEGARPLLFFVKDHAFAATFEEAKERFHGPPAAVATVEQALAY